MLNVNDRVKLTNPYHSRSGWIGFISRLYNNVLIIKFQDGYECAVMEENVQLIKGWNE